MRRRILFGALVSTAAVVGLGVPAMAEADHPKPPPPNGVVCWPGWGGQGGPKAGFALAFGALIPGDGTGDQNHTHCGPPGFIKNFGS
jgi:hypothetical protein